MSRWLLLFIVTSVLGCSVTNKVSHIADKNRAIAEANVKLATLLLKRGFHKEAKQKLLVAQKSDPDFPAVWYVMGYFDEAVGEVCAAKNHFERAIRLDPLSGAAHHHYGVFLERRCHYNEAMQQFLLAVQDPFYLETGSIYKSAGLCALKMGNPATAKFYFKKAFAYEPSL